MKAELRKSEKEFGRDMKAFEQLPSKTKEMLILKDQAEKATTPEGVVLNKTIRATPQ